jgi:hypothetical protein
VQESCTIISSTFALSKRCFTESADIHEESNMLFRSNERMSEREYAELLVYLVEEEKDIKTAQPLR